MSDATTDEHRCECGRQATHHVQRFELDESTRLVWLCHHHFIDVFRPYSFADITVETE
jgi:hypothetical protein